MMMTLIVTIANISIMMIVLTIGMVIIIQKMMIDDLIHSYI